MKKATALVVPLLLGLVAAAQGSGSQRAVNALRKVNPSVDWNASSAKTADFDCDGKADTVMIGFEKGTGSGRGLFGGPQRSTRRFSRFLLGPPRKTDSVRNRKQSTFLGSTAKRRMGDYCRAVKPHLNVRRSLFPMMRPTLSIFIGTRRTAHLHGGDCKHR